MPDCEHVFLDGKDVCEHQRKVHAEHGLLFKERHPLLNLESCDFCNHACFRHGCSFTQHCKSQKHNTAKAIARGEPVPQPPAAKQRATATAAGAPGGGAAGAARLQAAPAWSWTLAPGSAQRAALDGYSVEAILRRSVCTVLKVSKKFAPLYAAALSFVLTAVQETAAPLPNAEFVGDDSEGALAARAEECAAWCKLWQFVPMLLMSPDGRLTRAERFRLFAVGDITQLLADEFKFAALRARKSRPEQTWPSLRENASKAARRSRGLTRVASNFAQGPRAAPARNAAAKQALEAKHPAGDDPAELSAEVQAGLQAAREAALASGASLAPAALTAAQVRFAIMRSTADAAPGLSGLRIMHLQQIVRTAGSEAANKLLGLFAWLGTAAYADHEYLPPAFWQLHMAARLSAVGEKLRPIACGDTLRRIFGAIYCRTHKLKLTALFEGVHQFGVGSPNGVERLATAAQLVHQAGGVVLALDGRNAFNATSRRAIFREAAKHVPDLYTYLTRMYGPDVAASLLFSMDGKADATVLHSRQGVQQGDNLGPMLFSLALLPLMREFGQRFPHVSLPGYLDDLTLLCRSGDGLAADLELLRVAFAWIKQQLAAIGIEINMAPGKTRCLLPADAAAPHDLPTGRAHDVAAWASAALGGVLVVGEGGLVLAGVPVGSTAYVQRTAAELLRSAESESLAAELAGCRDTQLAFTLLRMCYLPRATFLTRNVGPAQLLPELGRFDAVVLGAFAAMMQESTARTPDADTDDWTAFVAHISGADWDAGAALPVAFTPLQQQQVRLRQSVGGIGLPSHVSRCHAAFMRRMVFALPLAYTALPASMRRKLRCCLLGTPLMLQARAALLTLRGAGLSEAQLASTTPAHWTAWAFAEEGSAAEADAAESLLAELDGGAAHEGMQKVQAKLCRYMDLVDARALEIGLMDVANFDGDVTRRNIAVARFRSQRGKGATAYLSVAPNNAPHLSMWPSELREAVRRGLGRNLPPPGGLCNLASCASKGVQMTAAHLYAGGCCNNGEQNARHHALRNLFLKLLKDYCKVECVREDGVPFSEVGYNELEMDCVGERRKMKIPPPMDASGTPLLDVAVTPGFGHEDKRFLLDASITNNRIVRFRKSPAGAAAKTRTQEKINHYQDTYHPASDTLFPFVAEFDGTLCATAHTFIRAAARHQSVNSGGVWLESDCVRLWRQSVSVCVQMMISQTVLRSMMRTLKAPGQPVPDRLAYLRVRLLRPASVDFSHDT